MKAQLSTTGFVIGLILLFAVNILGAKTLRTVRADLTEDRLYSLSQGTRNILSELDEPISLKFFFSDEASNEVPTIRTYALRVQALLQEYALISDGMISVQTVEPEPFSEAEDLAVQAGVAGLQLPNSTEKLYLGLVGANSTDQEATLPFFDPSDEALLEYDITKLIYELAEPERGVVGVMSSIHMEGTPSPNPMMGQGEPEWAILTQLRDAFEVRTIPTDARSIESDIDVLMVVHPKGLSDGTKYAIDQFVLRGGRVMAFVDPFAETDQPPPSQDRMAAFSYERGSELDPLLESWGLRMPAGKIAADRARGTGLRSLDVDYIAWLTLDNANYNPDDATISLLDRMIVPAAGILEEVEDTELVVTPLIHTTRDAMQIDKTALQFQPDPHGLLRDFVPEDEEFVLAARVSGPAKSAFPGGRPAPAEGEEAEVPEDDSPHLAESQSDINVVVVADVDLLHERYWLQRQQLGPIFLGFRKTADNGDFVINCIDNLTGSDDLISIRGGQKFARPFEYVKKIEREAEKNYLQKVQNLEDKIRETENKIRELQSAREDGSSLILTAEQREELEKLRTVQIESRRELRAVQHDMRKDIEGIGTTLKLVHIVLVPAVFSLGALAFGMYRTKRRK